MGKALAALPWVVKHQVDFAAKTATIQVDEKYDPTATLKAITDLGFGAEFR